MTLEFYILEFGEYYYKTTQKVKLGNESVVLTPQLQSAKWFDKLEDVIKVKTEFGGDLTKVTINLEELNS